MKSKKLCLIEMIAYILILILLFTCPLGTAVTSGGNYTNLNMGISYYQKADSETIGFSELYSTGGMLLVIFILFSLLGVILSFANVRNYDERIVTKIIRLALPIVLFFLSTTLFWGCLNAAGDNLLHNSTVTKSLASEFIFYLFIAIGVMVIGELVLRNKSTNVDTDTSTSINQ